MDTTKEQGLYYQKHDYASFLIRLLIIAVDGIVIFGFCWLFSILTSDLELNDHDYLLLIYASIFSFLFIYLVEIKRRWGTVGNLLTVTKVIDITGKRPSIFAMCVRNTFWILGPVILIVDLFWIMDDASRQMIRDKFTGVYVIKKNAKSIGQGEIFYSTYMLLGYTVLFKEIRR